MKHTQLILAAALVALAGCSKENIDLTGQNSLDNEIGFNAVTKKATKANDAIITVSEYGHDNSFKVWGWQTAKDGDSGDNVAFSDIADNASSNFMSNLTISWCKGPQNRDEAWRNSAHYYYWPYTGKIGFLAIHPSDLSSSTYTALTTAWDSGNKKAKATITNYTISQDDPSTQAVEADNSTVDLMFAYAAGSRTVGLVNGELGLVFKHALSQLQFKVKTNEDYSNDVTFTVNSVELNNIALTGTVNYANEAIGWEAATQDKKWYYIGDQVVTKDLANYGAANVMIPQDANADNASTTDLEGTTITINYTMEQTNSSAISGKVTVAAPWTKVKEGDETYNPAVAVAAWEPGKKYVYTLNFKLNEINFAPEVTDWIEVDMSTINIFD